MLCLNAAPIHMIDLSWITFNILSQTLLDL